MQRQIQEENMKRCRVTLGLIMLCGILLIINTFTLDARELHELNDNEVLAYLINFLIADKGTLIKYGAMSYQSYFETGQVWRALTCMYLHAGILHYGFNMLALWSVGKSLERRIGSMRMLACFNCIGILDAIVLSLIFRQEISVGASAGIFGLIGILIVMWLRGNKEAISMRKKEFLFLIFYSIASLVLGFNSFVHHSIALGIGVILGVILMKQNRHKGK